MVLKKVVPWPRQGVDNCHHINDGDWGYLLIIGTSYVVFCDDVRPSEEEIKAFWGSRFGEPVSLPPREPAICH